MHRSTQQQAGVARCGWGISSGFQTLSNSNSKSKSYEDRQTKGGPGQDLDAEVSSALGAVQIANVLATIEGMHARERLAFLSSFMQFIMELCHQIGVTMVSDEMPAGTETRIT